MKLVLRYIILISFGVLALFPEFIANDDPILAKNRDHWSCPVCKEWLSSHEHQTAPEEEILLGTIIPFDDRSLEPAGFTLLPPLSKGYKKVHLLGTDSQSRDVLAGIIYGFRYAIIIALLSVFIALIIGLSLGMGAAYYGNQKLKLHFAEVIALIVYLGLWGLAPWYGQAYLIFLLLMLPAAYLIKTLLKSSPARITIPIDQILMKITDTWDSLPALFILLGILTLAPHWSIVGLGIIIAIFKWPGFFRISRAELQKYQSSDWLKTLQHLGVSDRKILTKELSPLLIVPVSVHAAFTMASAVSIEATLSFLGLGLGAEVVSWGSLLMEARQHFDAWWLVIFPGLSLCLFLLALNRFAKRIQQYKGSLNS